MKTKPREKSLELRTLECLRTRMKLSTEEEQHYMNLEKGYEGEVFFDKMVEKYSKDWLILKDLLFEINHTMFQVDSLVIFHDLIYVFDVKNYDGDFFIEGGKWYSANKKEVTNPLHQLQRCERLFLRLLQENSCYLPIKPYVSFVNPEFYLYQAPLNQPFIFLPQLQRFLSKLRLKPVKLQKSHFNLAERLISLNIKNYPNMKLPLYTYEQLEKGITCAHCHKFVVALNEKMVI
ncbi:nuclease-related domain-containing protein [Bacillota bacterium Lsc_1132]